MGRRRWEGSTRMVTLPGPRCSCSLAASRPSVVPSLPPGPHLPSSVWFRHVAHSLHLHGLLAHYSPFPLPFFYVVVRGTAQGAKAEEGKSMERVWFGCRLPGWLVERDNFFPPVSSCTRKSNGPKPLSSALLVCTPLPLGLCLYFFLVPPPCPA